MTATVHVGFELLEGQADNMANTALIGGVGALKLAIERGVTGTGQNRSETRHGSGRGTPRPETEPDTPRETKIRGSSR
jgi:hypothetical protein